MGYKLNRTDNLNLRGNGQPAEVEQMTAYEAKQKAEYLLRKGQFKGKIRNVIDVLATMGVILEESLRSLSGVEGERSLRRYRAQGYIDLLDAPDCLSEILHNRRVRAWTLGPVGLALAERLPGMTPKGYIDAKTDRVTHDALCSLVGYHVSQALHAEGYQVVLHSKYEATIHGSNGQPLLEPDLMIRAVSPQGEVRVFLLEYHNEDFGSRVREKVNKYEAVLDAQDESFWRDVWHLPEGMPTILAAWTHEVVGRAYGEYVQDQTAKAGTWGMYLGRSLTSFLKGDDTQRWTLLNFGRPARLLDTLRRN